MCVFYSSREGSDTPLEHVSTFFSTHIWGSFESIQNYLTLEKENQRLAQENFELYNQIQTLTDQAASGSLQWTKSRQNFITMPCTIVSRTNISQHNYIIIDRGLADNVKEGDGVITEKGVVAIVNSVSENYSRAISIKNSKVNVSAKIGREGYVGSLNWDGVSQNGAVLSGIPIQDRAEPGDTVFTSGYSSIFPADIPIAVVKSSSIHGGSSAEINVEFLEDLSRVRYVMVVKNCDAEELNELAQ